MQSSNRRILSFARPIVACFAVISAVALTGCGTGRVPVTSDEGSYSQPDLPAGAGGGSYAAQPQPDISPATISDPSASSSGGSLAGADIGAQTVPDPLAGQDGLSGNYDPTNDQKSLTPNADPLMGGRQVKNWYWIRGSVAGGRVMVSINHIGIGSFSSRVDHEITDRLRLGINEVEFTQIPSTPYSPVRANLEIRFSQEASGALPVLTYNSQQLAKQRLAIEATATPAVAPDPLNDWKHPSDPSSARYDRQTDTLTFNAK